jgi:transcriptional regulator with XRE-family HTH domain
MLQDILIKITLKRVEQNFTQRYIASQLGISQSYYNKIEGGKKTLTVQTLLQIADILDTPVTEFLTSGTHHTIISDKLSKSSSERNLNIV